MPLHCRRSVALLIAGLAAAGAACESAGAVVDQSNDSHHFPFAWLVEVVDQSDVWQQGVTAGTTGLLSAVDLHFNEPGSFVLSLSAGAPWVTSSPTYSIVKEVSSGWNQFDLSKASLYVQPGQALTIGARGLLGQNITLAASGTGSTSFPVGNDLYPGGNLFLNGRSVSAYFPFDPQAVFDMAFRTYVNSAPYVIPPPSPLDLAKMINGQPVAGYTGAPISSSLPDFAANAFVSADGSRVVLAIPGTDSFSDWLGPDQTWILLNNLPSPDLVAYVNEAAELLHALRILHPDAKVTVTGHSLGGAIAEILGDVGGFSTTTFNAPGVADAVNSFRGNLNLGDDDGDPHEIVNYRVNGDVVSTVGQQLSPTDSARTLILVAPEEAQASTSAGAAVALHALSTVIERLSSNATITVETGPTMLEVAGDFARNALINPVPGGGVLWTATAAVEVGRMIFIDPAGLDLYELTLAPTSVAVQSILFPLMLDVDARFRLEEQVNGQWAVVGAFEEMGQFDFGAAGTRHFRFFVLDNGTTLPPAIIDEFAFGLTFIGDGQFEGQVLATSTLAPVPEPPVFFLWLVGACLVATRLRIAAMRRDPSVRNT